MLERETILEVGAELGSITLFGIRTEQGWRFLRKVDDSSLSEFDDEEEAICHESHSTSSWQEALALLDNYPWSRLYPMSVHSEFLRDVWAAVQQRLDGSEPEYLIEQWRELCGIAS